jgi:TRAP transporter TAXI family solute receptor
MTMRSTILGLIAALGLLTSGTCWAAKAELTMAGIGTTSDTYMLAVGWSNVLRAAKSEVTITPLEGGGTVKLLRGVAQKKWDIGFIGSPHYMDALAGTLQFKDDPADLRARYKDVRALFGIISGLGQYVVRADSGISSVTDLKGKKLGIGAPGGMGVTVTQALFKAHGMEPQKDYQPQYLEYGQALDEMSDKRLQATLVWGGLPQSAVYEFSRHNPVRFLAVDQAAFANFKKAMPQGEYYLLKEYLPGDFKKVYGAGTTQEKPAHFWTFTMMVVARADLPEAAAYQIVKVFWENLEAVKATGAALAPISQDNALLALSAPLHPGALKYYKEKGWK